LFCFELHQERIVFICGLSQTSKVSPIPGIGKLWIVGWTHTQKERNIRSHSMAKCCSFFN
jgi:hypothetical protein